MPFSRYITRLFVPVFVCLLTGCASYLQPVKSPIGYVGIRVEHSFKLGHSIWPGPYTWPAEIYKPFSEDHENIYFNAPSRVQSRFSFFNVKGKRLGGLLVRKVDGQVKAWYENINVGSLIGTYAYVVELNLPGWVSYTFINIDDNTPIAPGNLPTILKPK